MKSLIDFDSGLLLRTYGWGGSTSRATDRRVGGKQYFDGEFNFFALVMTFPREIRSKQRRRGAAGVNRR